MGNLGGAYIEMVEGEKENRLVMVFDSSSFVGVFELRDITRSVFQDSREGPICLNLVFQKNFSMTIKELSCRDAEELKLFLGSGTKQELSNPTSWQNTCHRPKLASLHQKNNTSGATVPEETPSITATSPRPAAKVFTDPNDKMETVLTPDIDHGQGILKENTSAHFKTFANKDLKDMKSEKTQFLLEHAGNTMKPNHGQSFSTTSQGNSCLENNVFATGNLSAERSSAVPSDPNRDYHKEPRWNESQLPLQMHPKPFVPGFPNLGNTCYMNATLQSLFAVPSFAEDLTHQGIPWEMLPAGAFSLGLSQLLVFKDVCDAQTKTEFLVAIQKSISLVSDIYSSRRQNDAQEFLGHCLGQLKEDMEKLQSTGQGVRETADGHPEPQVLAAQAAPRGLACPVRANFEVELQHSIVCKACGAVVCKTELSNYLSISLSQEQPGAWSLQDSLDFFFRAEELEYKCGKCKHGRSFVIQNVSRLPRVLIVHLKRYMLSASERLVKDTQPVGIPKYLSLSPHCNEDTKGPLLLDSPAHAEEHPNLNVSQDIISGATSSRGGSDKCMENKSSAGSHRVIELLPPADRKRHDEDLQQALPPDLGHAEICHQLLPQSLNKADALKPSEGNPVSSTGFRLREDGLDCSRAVAAAQNPGSKDNLEMLVPKGEAEGAERKPRKRRRKRKKPRNGDPQSGRQQESPEWKPRGVGQPRHAYRLISAVSHLGSSTESGHYVSDLYDFAKQAWFTYDDLRVSQTQEDWVRADRRRDGYIFFYMHNDIFELLLRDAQNSQTMSEE
ncbi:ubiquitin carboxyl-terminal hydrolase 29-like [Echinops telfairi]|uniref:ubiquitinyl hydrolase 1 n=1 Tax=Echinops telfairi TaxID=9371 RepID=A0ABM0ZTH8_ECHTE|nr:ubiquitin carboxyl-terminal hydrolase 29-like [Echinops telfairi]